MTTFQKNLTMKVMCSNERLLFCQIRATMVSSLKDVIDSSPQFCISLKCFSLSINVYGSLFCRLFTECGKNMYGVECKETCGNCSNGDPCHHVDGTCPHGCDAGMYGEKCDLGNMRFKFSVYIIRESLS